MTTKTVAELEAELKAARDAERAAKEAHRKRVPVQWKFTIKPMEQRLSSSSFDELYDDTCVFYYLQGEIVNLDEAKTAGHVVSPSHNGGMRYLYNTLTHRIVCSVSGGTIFVSGEGALRCMALISSFLAWNPEGGDITAIVNEHRATKGLK